MATKKIDQLYADTLIAAIVNECDSRQLIATAAVFRDTLHLPPWARTRVASALRAAIAQTDQEFQINPTPPHQPNPTKGDNTK